MLTESKRTVKFIIFKRFWILIAVITIVGMSVSLPWFYGKLKESRADSLMRSALFLIDNEDSRDVAWEKAFAAYDLTPGRLSIVRNLATVLEKADPSRSVAIWEEALDLSGGDFNDRVSLVRCALRTARIDLAEIHMAVLEKENPQHLDTIYLHTIWLLRQKEIDEAVQHVNALVNSTAPIQDEYHKFYVHVKSLSSDQKERQKGLDHLLKLASQSDSLGLIALRQLAVEQYLTKKAVDEILVGLNSHPEAIVDDKLMALDVAIRYDKIDLNVFRSGLSNLIEGTPEAMKVSVFRWMHSHGYFEEVIQLMPLSEAMERQDLLLIRLDCMRQMNQWDMLEIVLDRRDIALQEYLLHIFKMRVFDAKNNKRLADIEWDKAVIAASENPAQLWQIAAYANEFRYYERAIKALTRCAEHQAYLRVSLESLVRIYRILRDTKGLYKSLHDLGKEYPNDPVVINDLIYIQLLMNEEVTNIPFIERILEKSPLILSYRITLALGYLKTNQNQAAMDLFSQWDRDFDWNRVKDNWRLVYALVNYKNNRMDRCASIIRTIKPEELLPEELVILQELYK